MSEEIVIRVARVVDKYFSREWYRPVCLTLASEVRILLSVVMLSQPHIS